MERTAEGNYGELNAQMATWSVGRFDVPTALIKSPEEKYRARVAKQENVDALAKSILQFGTVNEHVQVVLFVGANQALPAKTGFKLPVTDDEMKARGFEGFFCIVGDHTQRAMNQLAMNQLHAMFSENAKWLVSTPTCSCVEGRLMSWRHSRAGVFRTTSRVNGV